MQTKLQWNQNVLESVFRELYSQEIKGMKDYIPEMFAVENSDKAVESIEMIGGEGLMEEWGHSNNQVYYSDIDELWQKYFRHRKFSDGREIDRDFVDDLKLTAIKDRIRSLAGSVYYTRQTQGAEWFINGDKTTTAIDFRGRTYDASLPDGKALFATDHPFSPTNSTDTQSNKGTDELSVEAVDANYVKMQGWTNDKGNLLPVMPNTLIVGPALRRRALQIAGYKGKGDGYEPDSGNFSVNVWEGDLKVIVNPFLGKGNPKAWVLADDRRMKRSQKWFDRRKPENGSITDFDTEVAKHKVVGRWSYGGIDWSWGMGNFPV